MSGLWAKHAGPSPGTRECSAFGPVSPGDKGYIRRQVVDHKLMQMFAAHGTHPLPPPVRRVPKKEIEPAFDGGCAILTLAYEVGATKPPNGG